MSELTVLQAIDRRRSVKHFRPDAIPDTVLNAVIEAACDAPSSWNLQPWRIVVLRSPEQREALAQVAWKQPQVTEAPVVLVFAVSVSGWRRTLVQTLETARAVGAWPKHVHDFVATNAPTFQEELGERAREYAVKDAMIAATHATLAAVSLGLGASFLNGWEEAGVKRVIGAGDDPDIAIAVLVPVGYASEQPAHPGRLPRGAVVNVERLGEPYRFRPAGLRSPSEQALGLCHLPRLIDKTRLALDGRLPGYNYMRVGFDKLLLEALDIEPLGFEQAVRTLPDDEALLAWVASRMKPMDDHEKSDFNAKLERLGMDYPRMRPYFVRTLHEVDPARTDVTTTMRLVDLYEGRI